jgi:hypothetical protein
LLLENLPKLQHGTRMSQSNDNKKRDIMRKTLCMAMACFSAATVFSQSEILLPHGFVTYSRGEDYNRVLCRAEIRPG